MDRPKALALTVSLTGVIAAATVALALNFGLVGASSPATAPAASLSATGSATAQQRTTLSVPSLSFGDDGEHESDDAATSGDGDHSSSFTFGGGDDD